jgi:hypothetical protein
MRQPTEKKDLQEEIKDKDKDKDKDKKTTNFLD